LSFDARRNGLRVWPATYFRLFLIPMISVVGR